MARVPTVLIMPAFIVGKFSSDLIAVLMGEYAARNSTAILEGMVSWKSITGMAVGLLLLFALLFVDWRSLLIKRKLALKFHIWK